MNMNMFKQFLSPELMLLSTITLSMIIPIMMIHHKPKLLKNWMATSTSWLMKTIMFNMTNELTPNGQKWWWILSSLLIMILLSNLVGLLPYMFTPTSQLSMNMAMALPLWMATIITGMTKKTISHSSMLPESTPTPLLPFMILIKTISILMRPLALGVRLTANITTGHLLSSMISSIVLNFTITPNILMWALLLMLTLLELAVACIQAYILVLLMILYLQENT